MQSTTWHVDIELADSGDEVTAIARLQTHEGPAAPGIGLGSVHHDPLDRDLSPEYALAARRSLENLSSAIDYVSDASLNPTAVDQA